ncbi:hypothetical protein GQ457_18G004410 [Hibiscus cannabinus]
MLVLILISRSGDGMIIDCLLRLLLIKQLMASSYSCCYLPGLWVSDETIDHVLQECGCAKQVWAKFVQPDQLVMFYSLPLSAWLAGNVHDSTNMFSSRWVKANADGAVGGSHCMVATGGSIHDEKGEWLLVLRGVLVLQLGFRQVVLETDNETVVRILNGSSLALGVNTLVLKLRDLLKRQWVVCIQHVYREANSIADDLARMTRGTSVGEWQYAIPPLEVAVLVVRDAHGL